MTIEGIEETLLKTLALQSFHISQAESKTKEDSPLRLLLITPTMEDHQYFTEAKKFH
jgi:hypothetical protein